jgi:hypothetical protein
LKDWQDYWYNNNKIISSIYNNSVKKNETVINFSFELFENSNYLKESTIIRLLVSNINKTFQKNKFIFSDYINFGIDDIFIGNVDTLYKLTHEDYKILVDKLVGNNIIDYEGFLVFLINNKLV